MEIILQEYEVMIEGEGIFYVSNENKEKLMVPTFGFDNNGDVKNRKLGEKEGYAPLKRSWIENQVKSAVDSYINDYKQKKIPGKMYEKDPFDYTIEETDEDLEKVYVFLFICSNYENEIGIAVGCIPFIVKDSKVFFQEKKIAI